MEGEQSVGKDLAEKGLVICDNCEGKGYEPGIPTLLCQKCWNKGPLDWIEIIIGRDCPYAVSGVSASSSRSSNASSRSRNTTAEVIQITSWKSKLNRTDTTGPR